MRICHVSPHLPPDQGANALLPAQLGHWSRARGYEVAYVAHESAQFGPRSQAAMPGAALAGPVRWLPRRARSPLARTLRIDAWRLARRIRAALDEVAAQADLLHLHSNGLIIEVAAAWARRRRLPYVLTLYGTEIWHYRRRWPVDPFTAAYRQAAQVTFYSQGLLDRARALGLDRPGLSVVYPAVGDAFAAREPADRDACRQALGLKEPHIVLNVKRLHALAGQRFLIEAFGRIARARSGTRLVICGTGSLRDTLEHQARRAGVADRVTFTGLVTNEDVARYAAAAEIFVLPSLLEALPTVAVEALACGTPVISADHPGGLELHELFGDDVAIVPRENVDALAAALERALQAPRRTRPETHAVIDARFRPAAVQAQYDAVYARAQSPRP